MNGKLVGVREDVVLVTNLNTDPLRRTGDREVDDRLKLTDEGLVKRLKEEGASKDRRVNRRDRLEDDVAVLPSGDRRVVQRHEIELHVAVYRRADERQALRQDRSGVRETAPHVDPDSSTHESLTDVELERLGCPLDDPYFRIDPGADNRQFENWHESTPSYTTVFGKKAGFYSGIGGFSASCCEKS